MKLTGEPGNLSAYHMREENYYFAQASGVDGVIGDGAPGADGRVKIYGNLCVDLGLSDGQAISENVFTNLLSGNNARGESVTKKHKVNGLDLTFSAPKTVSIAGLLTRKDPRITEAHDMAVLDTMREIEAFHAGTQPKAGQHAKSGNLVFTVVRDGFSREHDPHIHSHVIIMNMTKYNGKVMALDGSKIMTQDFNKLWGSIYRARLAGYLKEAGYLISYTKKGEWRLDEVAQEVEKEFSSRRQQIVKEKEAGKVDMDAWRKTREEKNPDVSKDKVIQSWNERLAKHQTRSADENRQKAIHERTLWFKEAKWSVEARQENAGERNSGEIGRWQIAARRATDRTACPSRQAVITEYLTELARAETWSNISFEEAERRLHTQVEHGHLVDLGNDRFTTWELIRSEREVMTIAGGAAELVLDAPAAAGLVEKRDQEQKAVGKRVLTDSQRSAAVGLLASQESVVVLQGDAGAGKTTLLKAVNDVAAGHGWTVVGAAVQGVAARKLEEESGIRSSTLTSYLAQERAAEDKPRLVVIDEASMLDSRSAAQLLRQAQKHKDKILLVGDRNQLQSVGAGRPFERLVEAAEARGALHSLTENYRQRDETLRKAVECAKKGEMRDSLDLLDANQKILEISQTETRRQAVASLFDRETLILTGTVSAREDLNNQIRNHLLSRGELDTKTERAFALSYEDDDGVTHELKRTLAKGEMITFLKNEYQEIDVRNGERATISNIKGDFITVIMEDGRQVELDTTRYKSIGYGYALTTFKSQGQSFNKVVVDADTRIPHLQDMRNTYVQISRARDEIRVFTDDIEGLKDLAGVCSLKRDTINHATSYQEACEREDWLRRRAMEEAMNKVADANRMASLDAHAIESTATQKAPSVKEKEFIIHNETVLALYAKLPTMKTELIKIMHDTQTALNNRQDLNNQQKLVISEYLNTDEAKHIWHSKVLLPDGRIAAARILSGEKDRERILKEIPKIHQDIIKTMERMQGRERGRGAGQDL